MKTYTVIEYEEEDFDKIAREMTIERAIELTESLPRGYFPYDRPSYSSKVTECDLDNFEICCALDQLVQLAKDTLSKDSAISK